MTPARPSHTAVVLLDIEGTTTPIAFVHETLFPFARMRLSDWWIRHHDEVAATTIASALALEHRAEVGAGCAVDLPGWRDATAADLARSVVAFAEWLMDRDRKSPGLKQLQGLIWEEGYQAGLLRGIVYDDVPRAMRRWRSHGLAVAIYSSGSELAQRRLFESTSHGDLTPLLAGFFDTRVGAKTDASSYRAIAAALGRRPDEMLFVSDVVAELEAARSAGCDTRLSVRPGNVQQASADRCEAVTSFDAIFPEEGR